MTRPKRLYKTKKGRYYIILNGKRKYFKDNPKISQNQLVKINIKNIIGDIRPKRNKKAKKRKISFSRKIAPGMQQAKTNLPVYFYQPKKSIQGLENKLVQNNTDLDSILRGYLTKQMNPVTGKNSKIPIDITRELSLNPRTPSKPTTPSNSKYTPTPLKNPKKPHRNTVANFLFYFVNDESDYSYTNFLEWKEKNRNRQSNSGTLLKNYKIDESLFDEAIKEVLEAEINEVEEEKKEMEGSGKVMNIDGLYTGELQMLNKKLFDDYIPVIPKDKTQDLMRYVNSDKDKFGFIINTNPSTSTGKGDDGYRPGHWTSVFIDAENPSIEFFDPLVENTNIPKHILEISKRIGKRLNKEDYFKVKINRLKRQNDMTNTCGLHAVQFLKDRFSDIPFSEATGYDNFFKENKIDDSKDGEDDIYRKFKKFKFTNYV